MMLLKGELGGFGGFFKMLFNSYEKKPVPACILKGKSPAARCPTKELRRNYPETAQKLPRNYPETTQKLPRNYPGTTQECSDQFFKHYDQFSKHYDSVMLSGTGGVVHGVFG